MVLEALWGYAFAEATRDTMSCEPCGFGTDSTAKMIRHLQTKSHASNLDGA